MGRVGPVNHTATKPLNHQPSQLTGRPNRPYCTRTGEFAVDYKDEAVRGALVLDRGVKTWPPPPPPPPSAEEMRTQCWLKSCLYIITVLLFLLFTYFYCFG